jgi:4-amino-4-deoxy-L-arabinose transferase-like glycosyltransferase
MKDSWIAALVLALAAFLVFGGLGARSIENKDITRTAEIARETLEQGRWLAPTREGELETEKPPLYIWLVAGLGKATGRIGALESRLPAAIASYLSALFVFFWLRLRVGVLAAAVAAGFLADMQVFLELARISRVDAAFAFFLTVSVVLAYEAKGSLGKTLLLSIISGVALAAAMLTKSPLLGLVLHLASLGGFYIVDLAVERPWEKLREPAGLHVLRRFLAPPASLPPILATALFCLWFLPFKAAITPAEWLLVKNQFIYENTERALSGSDKPQPPWFYVPGVLFRAAPGSLFALIWIKNRPSGESGRSPDIEITRSIHRFAQSWWVFPFLVLSIAHGKQGRYILPCLPGLAVAGALNWSRLAASEAPWAASGARGLGLVLGVIGGLATVALPVISALYLPEILGDAFWLAAVCGIVAFLGWRTDGARAVLAPLLLAVFIVHAAYNVVLLPSPTFEKPHVFVKKLVEKLPPDLRVEDIVMFEGTQGETHQRKIRILLSFYRDAKSFPLIATTPEKFLDALAASESRRGLVDAANWDGLAPVASALVSEPIAVEGEKAEVFRLVRRASPPK